MWNKAFFIGDHPALDFLNSIAAPQGEVVEFIADGFAYLTWLAQADLLDPAEIQKLPDKLGRTALDKVASEARELREWFRQVITNRSSTKTRWRATEEIAKLNPILATDCSYRQLEEVSKRLMVRETREFTRARQLLLPLVQAIAEFVADSDQALTKRCANPHCTLWFYDRSKAHRRRFCSAAVCGNRAKVAAFRKRQSQPN